MNYSSRYFAERSSSSRSHHIKDAAPAPHEKTQQASICRPAGSGRAVTYSFSVVAIVRAATGM